MLSKSMQTALNKQINAEFAASYLYLSMHAYFHDKNLTGFAQWMDLQSQEEMGHAKRLMQYVLERNGSVKLDALAAPKNAWTTPLAAVQDALKHEQKVSQMINALVIKARTEKDPATEVFLQWFVTEQVEEESTIDGVVQRMKMAGTSPTALLLMDTEMASRTTTE